MHMQGKLQVNWTNSKKKVYKTKQKMKRKKRGGGVEVHKVNCNNKRAKKHSPGNPKFSNSSIHSLVKQLADVEFMRCDYAIAP